MSKHILFLSHQASRTGAPFVLLHLLRWLKDNSDLTWEVIFRDDGDLRAEFEALSPVTVWHQKPKIPSRLQRLKERVQRRLGQTLPDEWHTRQSLETARQIVDRGADLIYSNTVANAQMLEALAGLDCPVICHVHELEYIINSFFSKADFELYDQRVSRYIAASRAVKENLLRNHAVPGEKVDVVHEFVTAQTVASDRITQARQNIRRELGIPTDAPVVIGSGTPEWRKGADLWVQMAMFVARRSPVPVHFIWVGGYHQAQHSAMQQEMMSRLQHDITQAGLEKQVHFPGVRSNILDYFAAADVFTMTSREDPFPLVNLEAATVGKPIVCFQNAGGTPEFVEDDCGFSVSYLDVSAMAARVCELLDAPELRQQMGARAAQKVRERHDISCGAPQIFAVIERCLSHAS